MYYGPRNHSPYNAAHLFNPSFAYMLANPEESIKSTSSPQTTNRSRRNSELEAATNSSIHVVEEAEQYQIYTDLPGVKVQDLAIELNDKNLLTIHGERSRGKKPMTFDRQFVLDDQLIEFSKITANLCDGVLQITAPKKQALQSRKIPVTAGSPPENEDKVMSLEVEVPGVKAAGLQVQIEADGSLVVTGERKRLGETEPIHRAFTLNQRVINADKLEAFLEDGVLTVRAPMNEPLTGRVIPITTYTDEEVERKQAMEPEKPAKVDENTPTEKAKDGEHDDADADAHDHDKSGEGWHKGFLLKPATHRERKRHKKSGSHGSHSDNETASLTSEEEKSVKSSSSSVKQQEPIVPETVTDEND